MNGRTNSVRSDSSTEETPIGKLNFDTRLPVDSLASTVHRYALYSNKKVSYLILLMLNLRFRIGWIPH